MPHNRLKTINALSTQVPEQFPEFVRADHPTFVAFVEAYYEFLELPDNALNVSFGLRDIADIDDTLQEFVRQFKETYLQGFPEQLAFDTETGKPLNDRRLIKNIKAYYLSKGSEKSYKFLFRILFDTNVEFFFPKVDILRVSDGKFIIERFMRVTSANGPNTFKAVGRKIRQRSRLTGDILASAQVDRAVQFQSGLYEVTEFTVSEIFGAFDPGQRIEFDIELPDGSTQTIEENIFSVVTSIDVVTGGTGFVEGEVVRLINASGDVGIGAIGVVNRVDGATGRIKRIAVRDQGTNYLIPPTADFSESAAGTGATATVNLGAIFTADGFFGNNDGKLSSNKFIQDSFYYQDYSYVLRTEVTIDRWLEIIKKVIHPAGLKVFGEVVIFRCVDSQSPHETRIQAYEIPLIGHYTPYTWLTVNDLAPLYPDGFDPGAIPQVSDPGPTVDESGINGPHVPRVNPAFPGDFTDFPDLEARLPATLALGSGSGPFFFAITSTTGTFMLGEVVSGGTSLADGLVFSLAPTGTQIGILVIDGEFVIGETITGGTSFATAVLSALVNQPPAPKWGFPYRPKADPIFIIYHHPNRRGMLEIPGPGNPHPNPNMRVIDRTMLSGIFLQGETIIGDRVVLNDLTAYVSGQDFTLGETVTGGTSFTTAVVLDWEPAAVGELGSVLTLGATSGSFSDGEDVTGFTSLAEITIDAIVEEFEEGTIDANELPNPGESQVIMVTGGEFSPGENIIGQTSGAVARVDSLSGLIYNDGMPWRDIVVRDFSRNMPVGPEILRVPRNNEVIVSDAGYPNADIGGLDGSGPTD